MQENAKKGNADHSMCDLVESYYADLEAKGKGNMDMGYVFQYILKNKNL